MAARWTRDVTGRARHPGSALRLAGVRENERTRACGRVARSLHPLLGKAPSGWRWARVVGEFRTACHGFAHGPGGDDGEPLPLMARLLRAAARGRKAAQGRPHRRHAQTAARHLQRRQEPPALRHPRRAGAGGVAHPQRSRPRLRTTEKPLLHVMASHSVRPPRLFTPPSNHPHRPGSRQRAAIPAAAGEAPRQGPNSPLTSRG